MSRDIVIVPTYDRPEFLAVCLEKLSQTIGSATKDIWVCLDEHADTPSPAGDVFTVFDEAPSNLDLRLIRREPHSYYGNSYNVLKALHEVYTKTDVNLAYIVEDDAMITPDFFVWHEAVQEKWHPFCSCAGRLNRSLNFAMNGPEAIDESIKDPLACCLSRTAYISWATCFDRKNLGYLFSMPVNMEPEYEMFRPGFEQDIFIQSILRRPDFSIVSAWPYVPRAYHMGCQSYHRTAGQKFNGTLDEKIAAVRAYISDPVKIKSMALLQDDIVPFPTQMPEWSGPLYLKKGGN